MGKAVDLSNKAGVYPIQFKQLHGLVAGLGLFRRIWIPFKQHYGLVTRLGPPLSLSPIMSPPTTPSPAATATSSKPVPSSLSRLPRMKKETADDVLFNVIQAAKVVKDASDLVLVPGFKPVATAVISCLELVQVKAVLRSTPWDTPAHTLIF